MTKLEIAPDLKLPLDLVTESFSILAKKRVGKSYTARRIAEQLFRAGMQVVPVDPKGDWWGMRSSADGKGPGLPILILGGEHGDLPLEAQSGELVAKLVVEERVSVVLDLSLFRKSEVATFITAFAENLYRLKAREDYRTPMMLILDEADAVAPQKPQHGEERMLGAIEDIVRRGGQRGIGCGLVTQRSAVLNKNVLTQTQLLIALRTIAPQDLKAMDAWIDVHGTVEQRAELMSTLPSLPKGDAWFWSPGWPTEEGIFKRVHVSPIETFDSGATPKAGEKRVEPKKRADVDLEVLRRQMAETVERAKASDPRELKKRIADLEKELAAAAKAKPPPEPKMKRVEVPVLKDGQVKRIEGIASRLAQTAAGLDSWAKELQGALQRIAEGPGRAPPPGPVPSSLRTHLAVAPAPRSAPAPRPRRDPPADGEAKELKKGARSMLQALASFYPRDLTRQELGVHAGISYVTGTFSDYLSAMRAAGYIEDAPGGKIALTEEGSVAGGVAAGVPRKTTSELVAVWGPKLKGASRRMFEVLVAADGQDLTREQIAERAGISAQTGTFSDYLSLLRRAGVIDDHGRDIAAAPALFLEVG